MARILALSSQVARGHVGNSAAVFALQRLGHDCVALPTILLSNHPGHARFAALPVAADDLARLVAALDDNGWLGEVDAVLTGYLPRAAHVALAVDIVRRVRARRPDARVVCDPVLGDVPKGLYLDAAAAAAIRDDLLSHADLATPNAFELGWLTGRPAGTIVDAVAAAGALPAQAVIATSVPDTGLLANVLVAGFEVAVARVAPEAGVPNGTGDLLAALVTGHWVGGRTLPDALALAVAGVAAAITASRGSDELRLAASQAEWSSPAPWPLDRPAPPPRVA